MLPTKDIKSKFSKKDDDVDLAILKVPGAEEHVLFTGNAGSLNRGDKITLTGFPNYRIGDSVMMFPGYIAGHRQVSGIRHMIISEKIVKGNSGGPVLDSDNKVVGVAVKGAEDMVSAVIPIGALNHLIEQ